MISARCIRCGRKKIEHVAGDRYFCPVCKILFEVEDDGDYSDTDPTWRLQRQEQQERHKRAKWEKKRS
jgi:uncharacterized Zn finger protein (UPF0148 family)